MIFSTVHTRTQHTGPRRGEVVLCAVIVLSEIRRLPDGCYLKAQPDTVELLAQVTHRLKRGIAA